MAKILRALRPSILLLAIILLFTSAARRANAQSPFDRFNPNANDRIFAIAVQPDGKILVGGDFTMIDGEPRQHIARLNPDDSLDMDFDPGANGKITNFALQPDGKILVVGQFSTLGGGGTGTTVRSAIGRLNPDGSVDMDFNPGADSSIARVVLQPDGKIIVGGPFTALGGGTGTTSRNSLGRLNPNGSVDLSFNPGANNTVITIALQPDGKILLGGSFTALGGGTGTTGRQHIGRLNPDGSVDL